MATGEFLNVEDHGEWLSFRVPIPGGSIPVKMSREALADHYGVKAHPQGLMEAYVQNAEAIHEKALKMAKGQSFTSLHPLELRTADF